MNQGVGIEMMWVLCTVLSLGGAFIADSKWIKVACLATCLYVQYGFYQAYTYKPEPNTWQNCPALPRSNAKRMI